MDNGTNGASALQQVVDQIEAMPDLASASIAEAVAGHGRFEGLPLQVTFDVHDDRRRAHLLSPITYLDPAGRDWPVPKDAWLDGASIPQVFWSIIGGPYDGNYLEASVVHDHYCITKSRSWRDTHRMFHEAMLFCEVAGFKARIMFYAVYRFGPRWPASGVASESVAQLPEALDDTVAASILADAAILQSTVLTSREIEALADESGSSSRSGR